MPYIRATGSLLLQVLLLFCDSIGYGCPCSLTVLYVDEVLQCDSDVNVYTIWQAVSVFSLKVQK